MSSKQAIYLVTLSYNFFYLCWRATSTYNAEHPALWFVFFSAEVVSVINLVLFIYVLWKPKKRSSNSLPTACLAGDLPKVDILIPCYREPTEVVEQTLRAAIQLDYPADKLCVAVLDDGGSAEMSAMVKGWSQQCETQHGPTVRYIAREKPPGKPHHAKAGNLNNALYGEHSYEFDGEFVIVFDSDHQCIPEFIKTLLPYFEERVGFVQTPQTFSNVPIDDPLGVQAEFFYGPIQQGKDAHDAVLCTGTNVMLRRSALDEVGGFYLHSITEDAATGLLMHSRGWESRFHSEPLAVGLAPTEYMSMLRQRMRWAQGTIQIGKQLKPLSIAGLTMAQRIVYFQAFFYYLTSGFVLMTFLLMPIISTFFHCNPLATSGYQYAIFFTLYFVSNRIAVFAAADETPWFELWRAEQYLFILAPVNIISVYRAFRHTTLEFQSTPKAVKKKESIFGSVAFISIFQPLIAVLSFFALVWNFMIVSRGYVSIGVASVSCVWLAYNIFKLWPALVPIWTHLKTMVSGNYELWTDVSHEQKTTA